MVPAREEKRQQGGGAQGFVSCLFVFFIFYYIDKRMGLRSDPWILSLSDSNKWTSIIILLVFELCVTEGGFKLKHRSSTVFKNSLFFKQRVRKTAFPAIETVLRGEKTIPQNVFQLLCRALFFHKLQPRCLTTMKSKIPIKYKPHLSEVLQAIKIHSVILYMYRLIPHHQPRGTRK